VSRGLRWIVPLAFITVWLILITLRQVALFPPAPTPASEVLPMSLMGGLVAVAAGFRVQRGQPLANATADYCGDLRRNAIVGRFVAFFGWPVLAAIALWAIARSEGSTASEAAAERASWTRSWAVVTLVTGLAAAIAWWRIILPNG
jgi:hypothetical protein